MPSLSATPSHYIPRTQATHENLHIRSAHDAHVIFEAVRRGWLPMVRQRLSTVDCELLRPGQVFCWEQENGEKGIERWTDGRRWSSSRARDNFLFYIENTAATPSTEAEETVCSIHNNIDNRRRAPWDFRQDEGSSGFTKQTYSAWVKLADKIPLQRWNITAYFAGIDYVCLPTVETDPMLSQIIVPPNVYATVESLLRKSERRSNVRSSPNDEKSGGSVENARPNRDLSSPILSTLGSQFSSPYMVSTPLYTCPTENENESQPSDVVQIPGSSECPQPRSPEDQRVLATFKIQL